MAAHTIINYHRVSIMTKGRDRKAHTVAMPFHILHPTKFGHHAFGEIYRNFDHHISPPQFNYKMHTSFKSCCAKSEKSEANLPISQLCLGMAPATKIRKPQGFHELVKNGLSKRCSIRPCTSVSQKHNFQRHSKHKLWCSFTTYREPKSLMRMARLRMRSASWLVDAIYQVTCHEIMHLIT